MATLVRQAEQLDRLAGTLPPAVETRLRRAAEALRVGDTVSADAHLRDAHWLALHPGPEALAA